MTLYITLLIAIFSLLTPHFHSTYALTNPETIYHQPKKKWTVIIYIAADNNLRRFVANNIKQMSTIGSNSDLNICVELHITLAGKKVLRRYYIEKNKVWHTNADDSEIENIDSGAPHTLVTCCKHFIENYPAQNYALILWNHGTGPIDYTGYGKSLDTLELFAYNPAIRKLELDRSLGFLDILDANDDINEQRGICYDDTTGNCLTNYHLDKALETIRMSFLKGQKLSIIGFDACFMQMAEIAHIVKKHAHIMVGSQEVELAIGWDYKNALIGFTQGVPDHYQFARDMVASYDNFYNVITDDYTLSAVDLVHMESLEKNIHKIAVLLREGLILQDKGSLTDIINICRNKLQCTHFYEPAYIDLHHFYTNIQAHLPRVKLTDPIYEAQWKEGLSQALEDGCTLITRDLIFANVTGKNLAQAHGVSIYFPESPKRMHYSYRKTAFATTNDWINFLTHHHRYT